MPSQTRSMMTAKGAARHCVNNIASREPSRGNAWYNATSPTPKPSSPLTKKNVNPAPPKPMPKPKDQMPRRIVAMTSRQKFALAPPISFAAR